MATGNQTNSPEIAFTPAPRRHDMPMISTGFEDIITGWRYCATMQLRTPLDILLQHNRLVPATPAGPPELSTQMWHGIWIPDLGPQWAMFREGATMSSDIGPIPSDGGDYLPFLIAVRTITEGSGSISNKEEALRRLSKECGPSGTSYEKFTVGDNLIERTLPRVVHLLPIPTPVRDALIDSGYATLHQVQAASDESLLRIKGLGPKILAAIRSFLTTCSVDRQAQRVVADEFKAE